MNIKSVCGKLDIFRRSKVASNSMILMVGKIIQMILSLLISVISARFLGPDNFGIVSYAGSIIVFFVPLTNLGLNCILAFECIQKPEEEGKSLGTSLVLQFVSGFLCILGAAAFAFAFERNDPLVIRVIILYSIQLLVHCATAFESWLQVHYHAKYITISTLIAYLSVSAYKIILLATRASVELFALSMCVDYIVLGVSYFIYYKKAGGPKLEVSFAWAKQLVQHGKSFILPEMMFVAYTQMDRIMLRTMLGERTVGYYAVALSLTSMINFVFQAIVTTSNPLILEYQKKDNKKFECALVGRFSLIFYFGVLLAIVVSLGSSFIVHLLYGEIYNQSAEIVCVLIWSPLFMYWGRAKSIWFIAQEKQKYLKWLSFVGVITNIILNYFLIDQVGVIGAAVATVFSQMMVNFVAGFFFPQIRKCSMMMLRSVNPKSLKYIRLLLE